MITPRMNDAKEAAEDEARRRMTPAQKRAETKRLRRLGELAESRDRIRIMVDRAFAGR